ncbi:MAG TPA: cell division protein FtsZ [Nitrospiraceae bacterium]|nr:cell division protein FtsZ [Nitrospiraceae bacterium]
MLQFDEEKLPAKIKIIGVGGGGSNAVSTMVASDIKGVEFLVANTDMQSLELAKAPAKLQIGAMLTSGRGAGGNPEIGRAAALEDAEKIKSMLSGSDMVFVTAGMGGGTGTGAAPVIASLAREVGALTVGVVTKPFSFEGVTRMHKADEGVAELKNNVDALILIPNERLLNLAEKQTTLLDSFKLADDVLGQAVKGISDVVMVPGYVNVDFADVKAVMANRGRAVMGTGVARGEGRAIEAAQRAIASPLLEDGSIRGARAVLINITGGNDMGIYELNEASAIIKEEADQGANIIFGAVINPVMSEDIVVTVIATGFDEAGIRDRVKRPVSLKEYMKVVDKPRRKQEAFDFRNESLGIGDEDLDKPTFLRRQAD